MNNKKLVITFADDRVVDYTKHTHPILEKFAEKWDADFKNFDSIFFDEFDVNRWSLRIKIIYDQLEIYDRILHLDSDVVINKDCPNIFDVVPYDKIGFVFEDKGSRLEDRQGRIVDIKKLYGGNEGWTSGYFNAGMFIVSRLHQEIFTSINGKFWGEGRRARGSDQTHLGYQIMKQGHKYVDLGYKWNHMSMFSEEWNGNPSRFDSHIIHYAGRAGFPDKGERNKTQLMIDDIEQIYGKSE